jgi:GNAT superfamily N-acetyltransferase
MLEAQYLEIATDKAIKPLDPDLDKYQGLEDAGFLRIFTVRIEPDNLEGTDLPRCDGRLIGYFVSIVMRGLHYQQTTLAVNDIMYIDPAYRGSTVGYRMIRGAKADLKNLGADILTIHMKTDYPFRSLLEKLDFHLTEENWECVL